MKFASMSVLQICHQVGFLSPCLITNPSSKPSADTKGSHKRLDVLILFPGPPSPVWITSSTEHGEEYTRFPDFHSQLFILQSKTRGQGLGMSVATLPKPTPLSFPLLTMLFHSAPKSWEGV